MKKLVLLTNDDGLHSAGIQGLREKIGEIWDTVVVAPDREQSAIGTAVTLRQPLRVQSIEPPVSGVEAYSVEGTPSDSVILALEKLTKRSIDIVVSGIHPIIFIF